MVRIGNIGKEKYANRALELLNKEQPGFAIFACNALMSGAQPEETKYLLSKRVKSTMRRKLFNFLKRTGQLHSEHRHYCDGAGSIRTYRREPEMQDIPSHLLNIEKILPNFPEIIDSIMIDAGKLMIVTKIEETSRIAENTKEC